MEVVVDGSNERRWKILCVIVDETMLNQIKETEIQHYAPVDFAMS